MADSKTIDDGGLAYPGCRYEQVGTLADHGVDDDTPTFGDVNHPGMSRRDWFAGQAITGVIRQCAEDLRHRADVPAEYFAMKAFEIADAMIAASKAGG